MEFHRLRDSCWVLILEKNNDIEPFHPLHLAVNLIANYPQADQVNIITKASWLKELNTPEGTWCK